MQITERFPKETGRDYALRILKKNIVSLDLAPGSSVSENELAASLGLSRTPVREALIELSKVGIVEIYPKRGSRIARIDLNLVEQAFFMRQTLECEVVKEVCEKAGEEELALLRSVIAAQDELLKNRSGLRTQEEMSSFMELDNRFHELFYAITDKRMVYGIIQEIVIHFDRVRNLTIAYLKPDILGEEHARILQAVEERDSYLASALVRSHLARFRGIRTELREQHPDYFTGEPS